jgi:serine/threonine protein kinase
MSTRDLLAKAVELVYRMHELDAGDWKAALDAAERSDPGVAALASELLAERDEMRDLFDGPVGHYAMALVAKDPFDLIGTTLDGTYVVERLIGVGGIGAVYKARHRTLPRDFAIKVIPRTVSDKVGIEGAAGSLIRHPAVVAITDHKMLPSGDAYLAMDYVEGASLRETLNQQGRIGLGEALAIVSEVASALDAAHEAGFVHRDIKPENILIVASGPESGRVRVIDFGIAGYDSATRLLEDPELTGIGVGTPAYMSPEQWRYDEQEPARISARTDVYSLAVVFFEMIAGQRPIEGGVDELRYGVLGARHRRLSEFAPELPGYVIDAVTQALSRDPAARPASASEFVAMLKGGAKTSVPSRVRHVAVPASLTPLDRIEVKTWRGSSASIEFYHGDLMAMPRDWDVDYLVVSANRNDYLPTEGSLVLSLEERGVDVGRLARRKKVDARGEASCWLSHRIDGAGLTIPVRHIIGFEPKGIYMPADKIDDFFRFLRFVTDGLTRPATVAMPLLGTGGKMGQVRNLVPPLIRSATHALQSGLNIDRVIVVERDVTRAKELRRELRGAEPKPPKSPKPKIDALAWLDRDG